MSGSEQAMKRWRQTVDELRAYSAKRTELWGDVDDITLASYVDETCSEEERRAVEEAMEQKPAVRELVDFLRNAIRPVWVQQLAGEAATSAASQESDVAWEQHRSMLCERLRVWLDHAGQLMADGVELLLGPARPLAVPIRTRGSSRSALRGLGPETPDDDASATTEYRWQIPVDELGYQLSVGFRRVASPEGWHVRCGISSPTDPRIAERARLQIAQPGASPVVQSTLAHLAGEYIEVASGEWEVTITVGDDIRVLPIQLGSPPS
jgi:hypothetical protein